MDDRYLRDSYSCCCFRGRISYPERFSFSSSCHRDCCCFGVAVVVGVVGVVVVAVVVVVVIVVVLLLLLLLLLWQCVAVCC